METKRMPPLDGFNPADVVPLPSAPPPSYDDACAAASNVYPGHFAPQSVPLIQENLVHAVPPSVNPQYPVQQVQIAPTLSHPTRILPVGRQPLKTTCTGCNTSIRTRITIKNRCPPTFWCIVLFLTFICIPCSCCPYFCCDQPYKVEHFCPRCNAFLGTYIDTK